MICKTCSVFCPSFILMVLLAQNPAAVAQEKSAADWPQWRGPYRNGTSLESLGVSGKSAFGYKVLWKASVGKGFSSFAISKGRAFTMGNTNDIDSVFCFDAETGKGLWQHAYACSLTPLSYEGGPSATPVVDGQRVYTLSKSGHLFCLDVETGQVVWSKKFAPALRKEGDYPVDWGYAASPLIAGEKLILSVGWAGMALEKASGKVIWDNGPGRPGYSSPVPFVQNGVASVAMLVARGVVGVDVGSGKILWTIPWRTTWDQNAPDVLISEGRLLVSTGHGVGCALFDITTQPPKELWRNKNLRSELGSPVLWKGFVYGFDGSRLACIEWATGERRWSEQGLGRGTLIIVDGCLIAMGDRGDLAISEATNQAYRPLGQSQPVLSGRCWTVPAFCAGRIFVRNATGCAVCLIALENGAK